MKMKKLSIILLIIVSFFTVSCLKDYLDKAPESGLVTADVFSKYENFKLFFDAVYNGTSIAPTTTAYYDYSIKTSYNLYFTISDLKDTWESNCETADMGRAPLLIKQGEIEAVLKWFTTYRVTPILTSMFMDIRICNISLQNMHMLKDVDQTIIDDFKGQAYFVRAYGHFTLVRLWGGMPYLSKVIGPDDQWDLPRLSSYDTYINIAADLDTAAFYFEKAGKMRRDPGPGLPGHLNDPDQFRPNGVAAKALKGRVLLYAASPLNNKKGETDWEEAAKANWEAIQLAEKYGYDLLTLQNYKQNFVGAKYTNEQLWAWNQGASWQYNQNHHALINGVFTANKTSTSGECPTQNMVDRFETAWGDPLNTEADRANATALGHYNEQDPYANRDPRFGIDILYNTAPVPGYVTAKIYYEMVNGKAVYSELLDQGYAGITRTGYYQRKVWGEQSVKNKISTQYTDPLIRLTELYLNFAEASNEAYGPNAIAPGSSMSAVDAINKVRNRVGMVPVQNEFTSSIEIFNERVKNERTLELYGEGHHYYDIRRWKDAPVLMSTPITGVDIEKVTVSTSYPTGYKYTRILLPIERQVRWKSDAMYYFPFPTDEEYKMKTFEPNKRW